MIKKNWIRFWIGWAIFGAIYIVYGTHYTKKKTKEEFLLFDSTNIKGVLEEIYIVNHGSGFKLKNDKRGFGFSPKTEEINKNTIFTRFAEKGDSVIKPAFSDTLVLIKNGKEYLYTFEEF